MLPSLFAKQAVIIASLLSMMPRSSTLCFFYCAITSSPSSQLPLLAHNLQLSMSLSRRGQGAMHSMRKFYLIFLFTNFAPRFLPTTTFYLVNHASCWISYRGAPTMPKCVLMAEMFVTPLQFLLFASVCLWACQSLCGGTFATSTLQLTLQF